jgi:hypothetical protein
VTANAGNCGRCGVAVADGEYCWYCWGPLCLDCWEAVGHCGHPEAEAANAAARGVAEVGP